MRLGSVAFLVAIVAAMGFAQKLPLRIEVRPLFGTTVPPYGCLPLKIVVQNDGPSVVTTLVVSPARIYAERRHLYPLPLPTGSKKEIIALPFVMANTMSVSVRLEGIRGIPEQTVSVTPSDSVRLVVAVGDEIGGLEWLRQLNPQPQIPSTPGRPLTRRPGSSLPVEWVWAYCRPEDLPDKSGALTGVSAIVLGTGAERLTMSQWQAIRRWIMMGGVLVVPGGSAAIYLRHVILASLLPIQNWRTVQHSDWKPLVQWLKFQPPNEPAFITVGKIHPDAKLLAGTNQLPFVAIRPYGYGAVVFVAFNLWDKPFRGWRGLPELWRKSVAPLTNVTVARFWAGMLMPLGEWQGWQRYSPPYYYAPTYSSYPSPVIYSSPPGPTSPPPLPFKLELPSVANLAITLFAYFALVVPLSYALLRRRRALDWQWLIAPVFALLFVFFIGQAALGLRQIGTQNLTRGVVVAPAGEQEGYLFAATTLFIQRAGNYLLDFGNAEGVFAQVGDYRDFTGGTDLETQDGSSVSTVLRVPNLSFRLLYFAKPITLKGTVDVQVQKQGNKLQVKVTNQLPFTLKQGLCRLVRSAQVSTYEPWRSVVYGYAPVSATQLQELAPQESTTVYLTVPPSPVRSPSLLRLVITAEVEGMDITPNLSAPSQRKSYVTLHVVRAVD